MWKRFLTGSVLIVLLSGAATATFALNTASEIAHEIFPAANLIQTARGVVTPVYNGGPRTYLVLGSDRRAGSKNAAERLAAPHSDTMLLVRFDPERGQTSVMSIPRDLLTPIVTKDGRTYGSEKINAAYTIGFENGGAKGAADLAAETVEHVLPGLKLAGIVDVTFSGFINVVDTLGCVYVNVDHRYYHVNGPGGEEYSEINLQPGYQKLCYQDALSYVRYRHTDSDFVRVARQQDFLRDLREQISPENALGQIHTVARAVGHAITSTLKDSPEELIELAKLVAFSQSKPLRQVKFRTTSVNFQLGGGSYVTTTPELAKQSLADFLHGRQSVKPSSLDTRTPRARHGHHASTAGAAAAIGLYPISPEDRSQAALAAVKVPFPFLYPTLQTGPATQQTARAYTLEDPQHHRHHAYIVVWRQNGLGGYYDLEGTDWSNPPIIEHVDLERRIGSRTYLILSDGGHIHLVAWRAGQTLYWVNNTLLEDLSNAQMLALAQSARTLR
jgi:LCP family protein required for cell wall assembly